MKKLEREKKRRIHKKQVKIEYKMKKVPSGGGLEALEEKSAKFHDSKHQGRFYGHLG